MRRFVIFTLLLGVVIGLSVGAPGAKVDWLTVPPARAASSLAQRLAGRFLLQTQAKGALWYVSPLTMLRYSLGSTDNAVTVLTKLSLAISDAKLATIPVAGSSDSGDPALRQQLSGRILRQLTTPPTLWYISPLDRQRYALGDQPLTIIRRLSLGITNANLKTIPAAPGYAAPATPPAPPKPANGLLRTQLSVAPSRGKFTVDVMTLDLSATTLKIMTDTSLNADCKNGCLTLPLKTYIDRRKAVAGMHGTYFCPYEYASCVGQTGYYFYPVFNSFSGTMINQVRMKYTVQPIVAIDTTNRLFYYAPTLQFHSLAELRTRLAADSLAAGGSGVLRAALSSSPIMVIGGMNVLNRNHLDTKQATVKSFRSFLGWKGTTVTFGIVRRATVIDEAAVAQAMGLDYALNLDGGGSTALYQNGNYTIGPGRNLPNAILLVP
ncbi:MAG: phosphodiester glycosidase family protein [Patescibacteria group bacterium]